MVTAESKIENVVAANKAGVDNYILKPFDAKTLKAKINAVFAAQGGAGAVARRHLAEGKDLPVSVGEKTG